MHASPFDSFTLSSQQDPASSKKLKITVDDIVAALQHTKNLADANTRRDADKERRKKDKDWLIDLRKTKEAFLVVHKVFATGEAYRPVSSLLPNRRAAENELREWKTKAQNTIDPEAMIYDVWKVHFEVPDDVEANFRHDVSVDETPVPPPSRAASDSDAGDENSHESDNGWSGVGKTLDLNLDKWFGSSNVTDLV